MSKERLEEALRAIKSNWPDERYSLLRDSLNYVISQAKRAQELERDIKEWETVNESWEEINTTLVEQNKRYREYLGLIEKVGTFADNETKEVIKNEQADLASEALESESHEDN